MSRFCYSILLYEFPPHHCASPVCSPVFNVYATIDFSWTDFCVISNLRPLQILLQWNVFVCVFGSSCVCISVGENAVLGHGISVCFALVDITCFPKWLCQSLFPPVACACPNTLLPHQHLILSLYFSFFWGGDIDISLCVLVCISLFQTGRFGSSPNV